jgi:lipopolysaccharide transport system ATP-binding protein
MTRCIEIQSLSKRYRIGATRYYEVSLRERLVELATRPFSRGKRNQEAIWALRDVSFHVDEGEVVGIIGRNGAGKSTLLKVLSKITYPTSGSVSVKGRIASLLEVGTGFHDELTGRENVYLNGSILGMKKKEVHKHFDAIVAFAGVEQFIDTPIKRYSSGMRMRLGFAVAAHLDPDVLIVDEVLAVGDAGFQKKCINAMEGLRSSGRTVLFVSHNMAAVENLCSRGIWIEGGRVRADGPASQIILDYMGTFSSNKPGTVDLTNAADRRGDGAIRYLGIDILDTHGVPREVIRSGDSVVIRFHYEASQALSVPAFGLKLFSSLGVFLTELSTWSLGVHIDAISPGRGYIDLTVDFLNLMPGRYFLSLWLWSPRGIHDSVEHCTVLDVEPSNYYKSGRGIDSRYGLIFLPCRWDLSGLQQTCIAA